MDPSAASSLRVCRGDDPALVSIGGFNFSLLMALEVVKGRPCGRDVEGVEGGGGVMEVSLSHLHG